MEDATCIGPYKATRLWNDVIIAFRQYLPCGRHRRYMKTFDNCFSGASATEWLLQYLKTNGNFGSNISREKATSLLNKLYRAGIFEEVKVSKSMRHKQDVQENRLYKFLPASPSKMKIYRLPLAPRNDAGVNHSQMKVKPSHHKHDFQEETKQKPIIESTVPEKKHQSKLVRKISNLKREKSHKEIEVQNEESYPPCHLITRVLSTREIKDTWKAAFLLRSRKILGVKNLSDVISPGLVDGYNVMHNCIYLNKSGIVTNIDTKEQLPHWVLSAMKCLARWPEPPEPGLPNYPGFEKDVFRVVKDYFLGHDQPLVPYSLYDIMTNVFVMAGSSQPRHSSPHHYGSESSIPSMLWSSASLENIILNLTKKYCLLDSTGDRYETHENLSGPGNETSASYNHNAFPSTDGMDKLGRNQGKPNPTFMEQPYGLVNQLSCPSMPVNQNSRGTAPLSRTTQSAKGANVKSDEWLSGISRKYGSVPNLKVSKFETVFGPDNRTVTRVFYQNGMTTDFGHDDEDGSFLQSGSGRSDCDKVQSTNCLYNSESTVQEHAYLIKGPIIRSKSFVDVKGNTGHEIVPESVSNRLLNASFSGSIARSSSFSGNSVSQMLNNSNQRNLMSNSIEVFCNADNLNSAFRSSDEPVERSVQNSRHLVDSRHSDPSTTSHNPSPSVACHAAALQGEYPHESHIITSKGNLNSSQCQPRTSSLSTLSYNPSKEERVSSSTTGKPLSACYGPGYRPRHSTNSERLTSCLVAAKSTSSLPAQDYIQEQRLQCGSTPLRHVSSECHPSCENQETEYSVVLDASKKKSVLGSTNLVSLRHPPSCNRIQSPSDSATHSTNSRSYSTHLADSAVLNDIDYVQGLSFSNITPFYSMNSQSGKKACSFMSYPQNRLSEDRVKNSLQMVTLLLPPANRRKLHLLLKMMVKMTSNPNLCLDPTQTTRSLVLGTFYPVIIQSRDDCDLDEVVQLQLVSFMLDYYDDIFTPPPDLKTHVSDRLKALQKPQVVYSPKPERTVRFCQQTTLTDFENQRISSSQTALERLLEDIVSDENMNMKEKQKRLKQMTYPTIYTSRFSNAKSEANDRPQKPKLKQPLIARPLYKLKSLRL